MRGYVIIGMALTLAITPALAGGKGGGGGGGQVSNQNRPQQGISLNYGKTQQTNTRRTTKQTTVGTGVKPTNGKSVGEIKGDSTDKRHEPQPSCPLCTHQ